MSVDFSVSATDRYISTGAPNYPTRNAWTCCAWVKLDNTSGTALFAFIADATPANYEGFYFSGSQAYMGNETDTTNLIGSSVITAGTWTFIAYNIDGSTIRCYYGAASASSLGVVSNIYNNGNAFTATQLQLSDFNGGGTSLDGLMYGFRAWNAVLTADELENERWTVLPRRWEDITHITPLLIHETLPIDLVAGGMTSAGSPATSTDNPQVSWGYHPFSGAVGAAAEATLIQEGFRWRNDDNTEALATWKHDQDVAGTIEAGTNIRLRMLIDSTGDPAASQFQLERRLTTDSTSAYVKVETE